MLELKDIDKWPDPVEMGKSEIRKVIAEVKKNLNEIKIHLYDYDLKYDLYLKSKYIYIEKTSLQPLHENLSKVNTLFNRLFNQEKIEDAKNRIEDAKKKNGAAVMEEIKLKKACYWRGISPSSFEDHLAWHTKERWDFDFTGQNIETYSERTGLMGKEEGKKWMIENELKPLENYLKRLENEFDKRES